VVYHCWRSRLSMLCRQHVSACPFYAKRRFERTCDVPPVSAQGTVQSHI
jgi:hypothetical protein